MHGRTVASFCARVITRRAIHPGERGRRLKPIAVLPDETGMKRIALALIFPLRYYADLTAPGAHTVPAASLRAPEPRELRPAA